MNPFALIISEVLYRPIFNILIIFLAIFGANLGRSIIALTIVVRTLLLKSTLAGNDMQKHMSGFQPKMQKIQEKYKDNPEKMSQETMKLFKKEGKGPLKGCLTMLVQLPVFIGLFFVIRKISANEIPSDWLYSFFHSFGQNFVDLANIDTMFLGIDLLATNNITLAVLAGVFMFFQMRMTMMVRPQTPKVPGAKTPDMGKMMGFMNIFLVFVMGSFVYSTAGGIGLYIITTSIFSVVQYSIQYRVLLRAKAAALFSRK